MKMRKFQKNTLKGVYNLSILQYVELYPDSRLYFDFNCKFLTSDRMFIMGATLCSSQKYESWQNCHPSMHPN